MKAQRCFQLFVCSVGVSLSLTGCMERTARPVGEFTPEQVHRKFSDTPEHARQELAGKTVSITGKVDQVSEFLRKDRTDYSIMLQTETVSDDYKSEVEMRRNVSELKELTGSKRDLSPLSSRKWVVVQCNMLEKPNVNVGEVVTIVGTVRGMVFRSVVLDNCEVSSTSG